MREGVATSSAESHSGRPDVFISYAREDQDFVRRLHQALVARGRQAWVDWEGIPPTAEWMAEVNAAIDSTDSIIFVLSPHSASSGVCRKEVEHAAARGKRIVPLVREEPDGEVPEAVAARNWIFFRDTDDFDAATETLVRALDSDLEWVRTHTRLLVRAREWDASGRDRSVLLRGKELEAAERWLGEASAHKEPTPTALQTEYTLASRRIATTRQRRGVGAVASALVVSLVLTAIAVVQRSRAQREALVAQSRELASEAATQLETDPELSLLLAIEGVRRTPTAQAEEALRRSIVTSRVRDTLRGHVGEVSTVAFSPNGERLVSGGFDYTARVWDLASGLSPTVLRGHEDLVEDASFSPDGDRVLTASDDGTTRVWDSATGDELLVLEGHTGAVYVARYSPDGSLILTAGGDGAARIWDAASGDTVAVLQEHEGPVYDASFSPDGSRVVTASDDDTARVWDTSTGRVLAVLRGHEDGLYTAAFASDGSRVVTASEDGTARTWEVSKGRPLAVLRNGMPLFMAAFGPDGEVVATAGEVGTAALWDAQSGEQRFLLRGHSGYVYWVGFSPDGRQVLTAGEEGTARLWDVKTGDLIVALRRHRSSITVAAFAPDGQFAATGALDGEVKVWDQQTEGLVLQGDGTWMESVEFAPSGEWVGTVDWGGALRLWDPSTGEERLVMEAEDRTLFLDVAPEGSRAVTGGTGGTARVWDTTTGELVAKLPGTGAPLLSVAYSPDGSRVATSAADGATRLWDPETGQNVESFFGHLGPVRAVSFSADGSRVATAGNDGTARVWNAATGEQLASHKGHTTTVQSVALSPDGARVASGSEDNTVRLWDARTGQTVAVLRGHKLIVYGVTFSPDGGRILSYAQDGQVRVWDATSGEVVAVMRGHVGGVFAATFDSSGRWVASGGEDGTVRLWDAATGRQLALFTSPNAVHGVAFSPDGTSLAAATYDGGRVYSCEICRPLQDLMTLAERRVTRQLSPVERETYLHADVPTGPSSPAPRTTLPESLRGMAKVLAGQVPPGAYYTDAISPSITLTLEDRWSVFGFDFGVPGSRLSDVIFLEPVDRADWGIVLMSPTRVFDPRKEWDENFNIVPFPQDFAAWLDDHPYLDARSPEPVTLGGVEGTRIDTVVGSPPSDNPFPSCGGPCVLVLPFSAKHETGPMTPYNQGAAPPSGQLVRWILLDVDGRRVLFAVYGNSAAVFDEVWPVASRILESVRFLKG